MVVVDQKSVDEKLKKLGTVVDKLEQLKREPYNKFVEDYKISDTTLHNMVLGVEVVVDIGNHLLAEVFQIRAESYAGVIEKLAEARVISEEFASQNVKMAKFRNLIIHEYGHIDLEKVYNFLQKAPDIFREFARCFQEFMEGDKK